MTSGTILLSFAPNRDISLAMVGAVALGSVGGWLITPDLDITGRTYEEKRFYRWHPIIGFLWQAYWYLYAKVMKHRGVSHWPFVGTLTRWGYLFTPLIMVVVGMDAVPTLNWYWIGLTYLIWSTQDIVHGVLDLLYSAVKRTF